MTKNNNIIAFIHIGKTGGLTLQSILAGQYGFRHCDALHWNRLPNPHAMVPISATDFARLKIIYPNVECLSGHYIMPHGNLDEVIPSIRYFCFLRDPIKRMASAYQQLHKVTPDFMPFAEYCAIETHRNQQCRVLGSTENHEDAIDIIKQKKVFVGLMEHFDESLVLLKKLHINELHIDYTRQNTAPSQAVSNALLNTPADFKLLKEATLEDVKLYEYVKHNLYQQYRDDYGPTLSEDVMQFQQQSSVINRRRVIQSKLKRKLVYEPFVRLNQLVSQKK